MSIEQLTKAEILAMLDVQKEAATQMQKVASSLHDISKNQEALLESMSELEKTFRNGLCDKVIDKINEKMGLRLFMMKRLDYLSHDLLLQTHFIKEVQL